MEQSGDNNNNVMIGSAEAGSTINITQHQATQPLQDRHINYEVDAEGGFERFTQGYVIKRTVLGIAPAAIAALAIYADVLTVATYFGLPKFSVALFIVAGSVGCIIANFRYFLLLRIPASDDSASYVLGKFVEKRTDGNYLLYTKTAKCIYPRCCGKVSVVVAPPRERHNHRFVGVCSIGGKQHTYTYDYNGIGYPCKFDWRPLDKEDQRTRAYTS